MSENKIISWVTEQYKREIEFKGYSSSEENEDTSKLIILMQPKNKITVEDFQNSGLSWNPYCSYLEAKGEVKELLLHFSNDMTNETLVKSLNCKDSFIVFTSRLDNFPELLEKEKRVEFENGPIFYNTYGIDTKVYAFLKYLNEKVPFSLDISICISNVQTLREIIKGNGKKSKEHILLYKGEVYKDKDINGIAVKCEREFQNHIY